MDDNEKNSIVEEISELIIKDQISIDEDDPNVLSKYHSFIKAKYGVSKKLADELTNEAFLYLKMKNAKEIDPLQEGYKFGAGFS